jgi:CubicO group peptidase (beta-lactamase class C family)
MTSSGFYVADAEAGRIAEPPGRSFDREATSVMPDVTKNPSFAGGMVSTAADYVRFSQMLLNGGELDGIRLLSPRTVAFMTADHLPPGTPMVLAGSLVRSSRTSRTARAPVLALRSESRPSDAGIFQPWANCGHCVLKHSPI